MYQMKLFYFVNQFSAFQECLCIIHCDQSHLFQSFFCQECLVTGDNNLIACQQSGQSLVMFFQVASVFEEVFMFFFANVHTYATEFASFNCVSRRSVRPTLPAASEPIFKMAAPKLPG